MSNFDSLLIISACQCAWCVLGISVSSAVMFCAVGWRMKELAATNTTYDPSGDSFSLWGSLCDPAVSLAQQQISLNL